MATLFLNNLTTLPGLAPGANLSTMQIEQINTALFEAGFIQCVTGWQLPERWTLQEKAVCARLANIDPVVIREDGTVPAAVAMACLTYFAEWQGAKTTA